MGNKKLDALMKKVQKDHGEGAFRMASDCRLDIPRIPTGIYYVDYATGGGVPIGRITEIYGKKSAGKTSMLAKVCANAQSLCRRCYGEVVTEEQEVPVTKLVPDASGKVVEQQVKEMRPVPIDCVNECRADPINADGTPTKKGKPFWPGRMNILWLDLEGAFSPDFFTKFGLDCEDVYLARPDYGEQAVDIGDSAIRTGECDLIVVDSLANIVPKKEREDSAEDHQVAVQARLINKMLRVWTASQSEVAARNDGYACTIILVNQVRQKISMFPVDVKPGGVGQDFATSLDIKLHQGDYKFDKTGRPLFQFTKFQIEKNKVGMPKMEGIYRMCVTEHPGRMPGDTWDDEVVFDAAKANGFLEQLDDGKLRVLDQEFEDEDEIKALLHRRTGFYRQLRANALDLMIGRPSDGRLAENKKKRGEVKL
jgi:RecA/RadA recombinase